MVEMPLKRPVRNSFSTIPIAASDHATPNSHQPPTSRIATSVKGVYVPAMRTKMAQWSKIFMRRLVATCGIEWYSVEEV
jgi:hypothetical protein